jgi:glycine C-acetyltransferase
MNTTLQTYLKAQIDTLHAENLYKPLLTIEGRPGARVNVGGRELINLSSNNYLGLASDPRLCEAASNAALTIGAGSGAVRPIIGNIALHDQLEKLIAEFKHVEDVLVFQSGFTSNAGTIPTIMEAEDAIITDSLNHASIIDGCRLSKAKRSIYQHCDMDSLRDALIASKDVRKRLIITDGVFSMDGDIAPLDKICALAEEFDAAVMVDDAHGSGVMGANGRGTAYHFGVMGGYIAGSKPLIDFLKQRARPFLFSTGCTPATAAACIRGIEIMRDDAGLTERLWDNTRYWQAGLRELGFDLGVTQTPITPVMVGDEAKTMELMRRLRDKGVLALAVVFPTVGRGKARVRTMPSAAHTKADFDEALATFKEVGTELGLI